MGAFSNFAVSLTAVAVTTLGVGFAAEENFQPVSGLQIRAKFSGMQLTDEVHWREVYERDGTLRSYSMGMADNCDRRHSLAVLFRWKVSNPLLIAATAVVGLIAYPLLQPAWVMVKMADSIKGRASRSMKGVPHD